MATEDMIRGANSRRTVEHEASQPHFTNQPDQLQFGESRVQPSPSEADTYTLFQYLCQLFIKFKRSLIRQAPINDADREGCNTLMVVASLIAAISFQGALNPPGGFIQNDKDIGMAVFERYLSWYLLFDVLAFISSLSVILLTIYVVPKWKELIKLAMFIIWASVFFTFMSFHSALGSIYSHVFYHPLIVVSISIGHGLLLVFAISMFIYSWYRLHKNMSTFLLAWSRKGTIGRFKIFAINFIAFLGAAITWLPFVILDIILYWGMFLS